MIIFVNKKEDLEIQDILLHAVLLCKLFKNKMELLMSIVFYAKHKDKMDILQLRKKSSELGISEIWFDVEAYIRKKTIEKYRFIFTMG